MRKFLELALSPIGAAHEARWIEEFVEAKHFPNKEEAKQLFEQIVARRLSGEPLAYIFGQWVFREHELECGSGVLIPRPETEELVELVLAWVKEHPKLEWNIADFGAGTGCIGISVALGIKKLFPTSQVNLTLLESSPAAVVYLNKNCSKHLGGQAGIRFEILESSWNEWTPRPLDLFLSNPPYLSEEEFQKVDHGVSAYEPKSALVPADDAAGYESYRQLLKLAPLSLNKADSSLLVFELGTFQADWIFKQAAVLLPNRQNRIEKDMASKARFLVSDIIS